MTAEPKPKQQTPVNGHRAGRTGETLGKRQMEALAWYVLHALQRIDDLDDDMEMLEENTANKKKLLKAIKEFHSYIGANRAFSLTTVTRYQHNETISTTFVESTMNYVVGKRFVKKQQMRWTQRGAHLLLQTRVQVLNDDLRGTFCRWFPGMISEEQTVLKAV
jgi:hypothetical protein